MANVSKAFQDAAKYIFNNGGFTVSMFETSPEVRGLIDVTYSAFSKAMKSGISREVSPSLRIKLDNDIYVFSGFKTYAELKEASLLLKDENGDLRPFEKYKQDILAVDEKYNLNYLRSEYNFATGSAQMASRWDEQTSGDYAERYNLQYRTAGDERVREEHARMHNITLPASDPFWNEYYPPNGWGCRCSVVQVRKKKYPATDSKKAMELGEQATKEAKQEMFRFNPGKKGCIFPPHHPYNSSKCLSCPHSHLNKPEGSEVSFGIVQDEICQLCTRKYVIKHIETTSNGRIIRAFENEIKAKDYQDRLEIARFFANEMNEDVLLTPRINNPAKKLKHAEIYRSHYENNPEFRLKCPDQMVGDRFYEFKGYSTKNMFNAFDNMIKSAQKQSTRIIIQDCKMSVGLMKRKIRERVLKGEKIEEVWVKKGSSMTLLYKKPLG